MISDCINKRQGRNSPPLRFLHSNRMKNRVVYHFMGLLEKAHRSPQNPKTLRLQVALKIPMGIPFFKKTELIFILHTLEKVASLASLFLPYGADQGSDRLGELLVLLLKNLHLNDEQDHANRICKRPANNRKNQRFGIILS